MVLTGSQGHHILAIAQHDEAGFFALQEFFNDHTRHGSAICACVVHHAQLIVEQHKVNGFVGFRRSHGHDHALACRQTIGFDHDGCAHFVNVGMGLNWVGEGFVNGCWNAMALHEGFGKCFRAFKLRSGLRRAKNSHAVRAKLVDHTCCQRGFGTYHRQFNFFLLRPLPQRLDIGDGDIHQIRITGCATIARCHVDFLNAL